MEENEVAEGERQVEYWMMKGVNRVGPLTFDSLLRLRPEADTPVWREGLSDWTPARKLPELEFLFSRPSDLMPPVPSSEMVHTPGQIQSPRQAMPPTYLAWSIVAMLLCCLIPGIVALVYSTKVEPRYMSGDYDGAKRASDAAGLWLIITFVCGLVAIPFQIVVALL